MILSKGVTHSPPVVVCLLEKGLQKRGGVTGTPGSPSFTLALNMQSTTEITAAAHRNCTSCWNVMLGDICL